MDGIQKTVHMGLIDLAGKVADGAYGDNDDAFQDDSVRAAFLEDLSDNVTDKMD